MWGPRHTNSGHMINKIWSATVSSVSTNPEIKTGLHAFEHIQATTHTHTHLCSFLICSARLCFSLLRRPIWYSSSCTTSVCCYRRRKKNITHSLYNFRWSARCSSRFTLHKLVILQISLEETVIVEVLITFSSPSLWVYRPSLLLSSSAHVQVLQPVSVRIIIPEKCMCDNELSVLWKWH